MRELEETIRQLEEYCRRLLREHPAGLSEHALIQALRSPPCALLSPLEPNDNLGLFRSHFLLFHVLYRLRERLLGEQAGMLEISPLLIRIMPYRQGETGLDANDPLRDYYLDLKQLECTGEQELEAMLKGFWSRLDAGEQHRQALAVLELDAPVDFAAVKRQYQRLVMQQHPDRGGKAERMQELNEAFAVLQRFYRG